VVVRVGVDAKNNTLGDFPVLGFLLEQQFSVAIPVISGETARVVTKRRTGGIVI
jgi:hypothetical protein